MSETTMTMQSHPTAMRPTGSRRVRHSSRSAATADRKQAADALQRALDRRDNGGETGH